MSTNHTLLSIATEFSSTIDANKKDRSDINWYPYQSMNNIGPLEVILPTEIRQQIVDGLSDWRVLDVGAADGDLGYFFESRDATVDFLDHPDTNFNDCNGLRAQGEMLGSRAKLIEKNIDRGFALDSQYDFAIALGLLYHLRNPVLFLMELASHSERMVLSTRIAAEMCGIEVKHMPLAYMLDTRESNNDPTNYWAFSERGLLLTLKRSGWIVKASHNTGCLAGSNPIDPDKDERIFVYCERVPNWADLWKHHDF